MVGCKKHKEGESNRRGLKRGCKSSWESSNVSKSTFFSPGGKGEKEEKINGAAGTWLKERDDPEYFKTVREGGGRGRKRHDETSGDALWGWPLSAKEGEAGGLDVKALPCTTEVNGRARIF